MTMAARTQKESWGERFASTLQALQRPLELPDAPATTPPADMARAWLALCGEGQTPAECAEAHRKAVRAYAEYSANTLERLIIGLESRLVESDPEAGILRVTDFGARIEDFVLDPSRGLPPIVFAELGKLPAGHFLRTAMPEGQFFRMVGDAPAVCLGRAVRGTFGWQPRLVHSVARVLKDTRDARAPQIEAEENAVRERERLAAFDKAVREANPAYRIQTLEDEIRSLRSDLMLSRGGRHGDKEVFSD